MERMHWQDAVTLLAGIVLIAALFVMNVTMPEGASSTIVTWNFVLIGFATVATAVGALYAFQAWEEWVAAILGVWMIVSPWALGFASAPSLMWLAVICGAVIVAMAVFVLLQSDEAV
ncbi:SPW repeat protein [Histidinibacterium aquaticum]|uniref:SPW repeat-containing integral membrane domain-containing protein n=1 Tax=Histidinibacterium aquaticum TaxID=2613962 RepID=A0A5J5GF25_9RHOB|nr:SPW repeat protein [Histidinibacterium aquaticum]KAA9006701.1 hypothetical protein F3S47_13025 [Histidinibacterium aquaticum]